MAVIITQKKYPTVLNLQSIFIVRSTTCFNETAHFTPNVYFSVSTYLILRPYCRAF